MANGHGGYRKPSSPAAVSGPGSMSKRTDGRQGARWVESQSYGDGKDMMELQTSAPMSETRTPMPRAKAGAPAPAPAPVEQVVPMFAPTQRPDEPVSAGAPWGPGPGPSITEAPPHDGSLASTLRKLAPYDDTGQILYFLSMAERRGW